MPLMPLSSTRVYDPVLTSLSVGYTNMEAIWNVVSPAVPVNQYGGQLIVFDSSNRSKKDFTRAPGTGYKNTSREYSSQAYSLILKGAQFPVPFEHVVDAQNIGLQWDQIAIQTMMDELTLEIESEVATMVSTAGSYGSALKTTLSGTDQWNDPTSDVFDAVKSAKSAVAKACGRDPNVFWMGREVFDALTEHPAIVSRFKDTQTGIITREMIAQAFGVERVAVGSMVDSSTGTDTYIWGKFAGLSYTNPRALATGRTPFGLTGDVNNYTPSFAYTYAFNQHPLVKPVITDEENDCYKYQVKFDRQPKLTSITSGYLFTAAVAQVQTMPVYPVVQPLRHNGKAYRIGDSVELTEIQANILLALPEPAIEAIKSEEFNEPFEAIEVDEIQSSEPEIVTDEPTEELATEPTDDPLGQTDDRIWLNDPDLTVDAIAVLPYISDERAEAILEERAALGGQFTDFEQVPYLRDSHLESVRL